MTNPSKHLHLFTHFSREPRGFKSFSGKDLNAENFFDEVKPEYYLATYMSRIGGRNWTVQIKTPPYYLKNKHIEDRITPTVLNWKDDDIQLSNSVGGNDVVRKGWQIFHRLDKHLSTIIKFDTPKYRQDLANEIRECLVGKKYTKFGIRDTGRTGTGQLVSDPVAWETMMVALQNKSNIKDLGNEKVKQFSEILELIRSDLNCDSPSTIDKNIACLHRELAVAWEYIDRFCIDTTQHYYVVNSLFNLISEGSPVNAAKEIIKSNPQFKKSILRDEVTKEINEIISDPEMDEEWIKSLPEVLKETVLKNAKSYARGREESFYENPYNVSRDEIVKGIISNLKEILSNASPSGEFINSTQGQFEKSIFFDDIIKEAKEEASIKDTVNTYLDRINDFNKKLTKESKANNNQENLPELQKNNKAEISKVYPKKFKVLEKLKQDIEKSIVEEGKIQDSNFKFTKKGKNEIIDDLSGADYLRLNLLKAVISASNELRKGMVEQFSESIASESTRIDKILKSVLNYNESKRLKGQVIDRGFLPSWSWDSEKFETLTADMGKEDSISLNNLTDLGDNLTRLQAPITESTSPSKKIALQRNFSATMLSLRMLQLSDTAIGKEDISLCFPIVGSALQCLGNLDLPEDDLSEELKSSLLKEFLEKGVFGWIPVPKDERQCETSVEDKNEAIIAYINHVSDVVSMSEDASRYFYVLKDLGLYCNELHSSGVTLSVIDDVSSYMSPHGGRHLTENPALIAYVHESFCGGASNDHQLSKVSTAAKKRRDDLIVKCADYKSKGKLVPLFITNKWIDTDKVYFINYEDLKLPTLEVPPYNSNLQTLPVEEWRDPALLLALAGLFISNNRSLGPNLNWWKINDKVTSGKKKIQIELLEENTWLKHLNLDDLTNEDKHDALSQKSLFEIMTAQWKNNEFLFLPLFRHLIETYVINFKSDDRRFNLLQNLKSGNGWVKHINHLYSDDFLKALKYAHRHGDDVEVVGYNCSPANMPQPNNLNKSSFLFDNNNLF